MRRPPNANAAIAGPSPSLAALGWLLLAAACSDGVAVAIRLPSAPQGASGVVDAGRAMAMDSGAAVDPGAMTAGTGGAPIVPPPVDASDPMPVGDAGALPPATLDVPANAYCADAADWPADSSEREQALFELITELRSPGAFECGGETYSGLQPLRPSPELRCSARLHSRDMVMRQFRDITNPDGEGPPDRMAAAGSRFDRWGEVYRSIEDPARALAGFLADETFGCVNLGNPAYRSIGIGYYEGVWTVDFTDG